MKRLLLMFAFILSICSVNAADISVISLAFSSGNASALTGMMDTVVDMAVPGDSRKCNSAEAISVLTSFFNSNKPNSFKVIHQATKKDSGFFVGKLPTKTTEYRVNITYRSSGDKLFIQSIRIE